VLLPVPLYRAQRRRLQLIVRRNRHHLLVQRARILLLVFARPWVCSIVEQAGCVRASVYRTVSRFPSLDEDSLRGGNSDGSHSLGESLFRRTASFATAGTRRE
jgi:hypothetical protein